jgi:DNA-directed RNA polymerase subunit RPC12/RpoP
MQARKLEIACPVCASPEVFYTCTPDCCFNHVCNNCGSTFEPATTATGKTVSPIAPPDPLPDASDPTVACAKCYATAVYAIGAGELACAKCGSVLVLEMTEVWRPTVN